MRLLMVGPWAQVAMRRHIDWAVEAGIDVCVADLPQAAPSELPKHFKIANLAPQKPGRSGRIGPHRHSALARQIGTLRLRALRRAFQPHVIHSYKLGYHTAMCLEAGLAPLAVSVWSHLSNLLESRATRDDIHWIRRLQTSADVLLVENPNLSSKIAKLTGGALRTECIPLGVDGRVFHPGYEELAAAWRYVLDIPDNATVLFSPRGWSEIFGQHHILRAFASASQRVDSSMVLVFIGLARKKYPGPYAQQVLDLGATLGVTQFIRWVPPVQHQDMPGLYALADIVINYKSTDAYPSTLVEVAACARPVVTSAIPAYRNTFIEEFFTLVEPENPEALADAIVEMVQTPPEERAPQAQLARQRVMDDHDESTCKRRLLDLYAQMALTVS